MKKQKKTKFKVRIPIDVALLLRKKHSIKENRKKEEFRKKCRGGNWKSLIKVLQSTSGE